MSEFFETAGVLATVFVLLKWLDTRMKAKAARIEAIRAKRDAELSEILPRMYVGSEDSRSAAKIEWDATYAKWNPRITAAGGDI